MAHGTARAEATARVNAKLRFYTHLTVYLLVNTLLVVINVVTSTKQLWFLWPLVGWGIGLVAHAVAYFLRWRGVSIKSAMIERELKKGNAAAPPQS